MNKLLFCIFVSFSAFGAEFPTFDVNAVLAEADEAQKQAEVVLMEAALSRKRVHSLHDKGSFIGPVFEEQAQQHDEQDVESSPDDQELQAKKNKKYPCTMCKKVFTTSSSLKTHQRIHSVQKPFPCIAEGCGKAFTQLGNLQRHFRKHSGERPYLCKECGKDFADQSHLKAHERTHSGERPYPCTVKKCGKAFTHSGDLKKHLRMHSGERPYQCEVKGCGKTFTQLSNLNVHGRVHSEAKLYKCQICKKTFTRSHSLKYHQRAQHEKLLLTAVPKSGAVAAAGLLMDFTKNGGEDE